MTAVRSLALALLLVVSAAAPLAGAAAGASGHAEFEDSVVRGGQEETVEIPIAVSGDAVRVTVGSEDVNFVAHATVADADGDSTVTLRLDMATAGNGDASSYLSVPGGDALRSASQETPEIEPPLDAGSYDLSLGPPEDPMDIATLIVEAPSDRGPNYINRTTSADARTTTPGKNGTTLVYEGDELELAAEPGQTVRGETALAPGTELDVRLRSLGENFFVEADHVTVSQYGTFEATFDLTGVEPGTTFEVDVRGDGRRLLTRPGRVTGCDGGCPTPEETDRAATEGLPADEIAIASHVEVTQTHEVLIPFTLGDADAVTLVVGGESVNYRAVATVRDQDDDDRAVVTFDTGYAGNDAPTLLPGDSDTRVDRDSTAESELPDVLAPAAYPIRVYAGTNATGEPAANGTLVVYEAPSAVGSTTTTTVTATTTVNDSTTITDTSNDALLAGSTVWGVGAVLTGGILAVVGVGLVLGFGRG